VVECHKNTSRKRNLLQKQPETKNCDVIFVSSDKAADVIPSSNGTVNQYLLLSGCNIDY